MAIRAILEYHNAQHHDCTMFLFVFDFWLVCDSADTGGTSTRVGKYSWTLFSEDKLHFVERSVEPKMMTTVTYGT